jgi:hypothetical protein
VWGHVFGVVYRSSIVVAFALVRSPRGGVALVCALSARPAVRARADARTSGGAVVHFVREALHHHAALPGGNLMTCFTWA